MLNIRLSRVGKRNYAQYKIVVAEKTSPIKGKFVEQLGSYDPHTKEIVAKEDRIKYWISQGAGCSETVHNLLVEKKIIEGDKIQLTLKSKKKGEESEGDGEDKKTDKEDSSVEKSEEGAEKGEGDKSSEKKEDTSGEQKSDEVAEKDGDKEEAKEVDDKEEKK